MDFNLPPFPDVRPAWLSKRWTDAEFEKLTDAEWKQMEADLAAYNKAVQNHTAQVMAAHNNLCEVVAQMYGKHDKVTKYIQSNSPPRKNWESMTSLTSMYKVYQEKARTIAKERAANDLLIKAVVFLTQHGKIPDVDFTAENAIRAANDIRFDELIKEHIASGEMFSFGGDDYCEDCSGWDGESHRCSCGNRRVYWDREGNFTDMYVYAMAD